MKNLSYKQWTVVCGLLLIGAIALNQVLHVEETLLVLLVVPSLVAGLTTTPRRTAIFGAATIAAAIVLGSSYDELGSTSHSVRVTVVFGTSLLAVQTAILRERDLRTRRRLSLINFSRRELAAASGMEDSLRSFARAATIEFAEWAFLDLRMRDGSSSRFIRRIENSSDPAVARETASSASTAYELAVHRDGPELIRAADRELLSAFFQQGADDMVGSNVIVVPVDIGDVRAAYFLFCNNPHPLWGEAELSQVETLARGAALKARSDQLIDQLSFAQSELRTSRDEVRAIVQGIADGVTAQSINGEMVYANDLAAEMLGFDSAEELIGTPFSEVHPRMELFDERGNPFDPAQLPSKRAFAGEEAPQALLRYVIRETGREYWTMVKSTALRDEDGVPQLAITVIEDVTERRREELSQAFLAEASKQISESLDYDSTLDALAHAAVPQLADWCTIEMLESDGSITTRAVAHQDHESEAAVQAFRERFPFSDESFGPPQVIRTGEPELYTTLDSARFDEIYGQAEGDAVARREAVLELAPRSSLVAPISIHGETIGAISMAITRPGVKFSEHDLQTATELGRRAGVTLDNARLHTERMRMLSSLQKSLIPARLPELPGLVLSSRFRPAQVDAEVGGDFYDVFTLSDGSQALLIGDVCGKGPEAAAVTALARYTVRASAMEVVDPQEIAKRLNAALLEQVEDDRFCTIALARFTTGDGPRNVELVVAGHPLPVLLGNGSPTTVGALGTLLGVVETPNLPVHQFTMSEGESLVLYTDGLSGGLTTDDAAMAVEVAAEVDTGDGSELADRIDTAALARQSGPNRDDVAVLTATIA